MTDATFYVFRGSELTNEPGAVDSGGSEVEHMAAQKRTKFQREKDLLRTEELYLNGYTQAAIAGEMGVSQQQINYDIRAILDRWRDEMVQDIDKAKARELRRVDRLEREYWTLYRTNNAPETLARVQWCVEQRCKILGLNAPKAAVGRSEKPAVDDRPLKELSTEELIRLMEETQPAVDEALGAEPDSEPDHEDGGRI